MFNSAEVMSKRFFVSSDSGMKTVVPLLHCSINDRPTLISRIRHCQNALTKLINFLDSTFLQVYNPLLRNLLRILCTEKYYNYPLVTCNNYLSEFLKVQWLHLQVWWTMPQSLMSDFLRIPHTKNYYKTCPFLAELLKIKIFHRFFETRCL